MRKRQKFDHYVNVMVIETRKVERQLGPFGSRRFANRAETGILRTLDPRTHFTAITTRKEPP